MSTETVPTLAAPTLAKPTLAKPTLAVLRASHARLETVVRWLRPLAPVVMAVVIWTAFTVRPAPGLSGRGLAVSVALVGFALAGLGGLATVERAGPVHVVCVVTVLATSVTQTWLQPDGAAVAGIFVGVSLLAPLVSRYRAIPLTLVAVACLGAVVAAGGRGSVGAAVLNGVMLGAFYGMFFLALRLGETSELAEHLLVELEQSRAAEASAAGLAERQRLAREMHDVLAHSLSGLILQLEGARMMATEGTADPRLPQVINRAHQLGRTGLDEARRAIGMLRDDELPGPERLAGLAAQFEQDRAVPCRLTVSGTVYELHSEARLALYRVAQEALTNIIKHASPDRVELHLAYEPAGARLTVEDFAAERNLPPADSGSDSGSGSDVGVRCGSGGGSDSCGYGLTGMRERAELLGGTLTTASTRGGFRVELDVPA